MILWHYDGASQRDADHLHQGVGFLTQHAKFSLMMEDTLDAVRAWLRLVFFLCARVCVRVGSSLVPLSRPLTPAPPPPPAG